MKKRHKHNYIPCLFSYYFTNVFTGNAEIRYAKGEYCVDCGKIHDLILYEANEDHVMLTNKEFYNKYKHLPIIELGNLFKKYVK